jgi:hypothetical protein
VEILDNGENHRQQGTIRPHQQLLLEGFESMEQVRETINAAGIPGHGVRVPRTEAAYTHYAAIPFLLQPTYQIRGVAQSPE